MNVFMPDGFRFAYFLYFASLTLAAGIMSGTSACGMVLLILAAGEWRLSSMRRFAESLGDRRSWPSVSWILSYLFLSLSLFMAGRMGQLIWAVAGALAAPLVLCAEALTRGLSSARRKA